MKAESWEFVFSEKCDVVRAKDSLLFKLPCVLVRFNHIASFVANANHSIMWAAVKLSLMVRFGAVV